MEFSGKVVLITGASSGIGASTALLLAGKAARLTLQGRDSSALAGVAKGCEAKSGSEVLQVVGSLEDEGLPQRLVDLTVAKFGQLDVLVNNAGTGLANSVFDLKPKEMETVFQVNLFAAAKLTSAATPHLIKTKGNIVNVSSIASSRPLSSLLAYGMSKAALDQMTRSNALDLAPKGVRVNAVNPGTVLTKIQKRSGMSDDQFEQYKEGAKSAHALGRLGEPEEVASVIAFLAGPGASFITGVCLPIDGGRHIMSPVAHLRQLNE